MPSKVVIHEITFQVHPVPGGRSGTGSVPVQAAEEGGVEAGNILSTPVILSDGVSKALRTYNDDPTAKLLYGHGLPARLLHERAELDSAHFSSHNSDQVNLVDMELQSAITTSSANFKSALDAFCPKDHCLTLVEFEGDSVPVAWDDAHLTIAGSRYLTGQLELVEAQ